jgi:DNA-binding NtrC family response regulator
VASVDQTVSKPERVAADRADIGPRAYLLVVEGDSSSLFHLPSDGTVVIGRASDAEVKLTHASVSRRHASIRIDGGVARVSDLGSHNGTQVNGESVTGARVLASGDVVAVGDVLLVVHSARPVVAARTYGEADWRQRLDQELSRALTYRRSLAVVAIAGAPARSVVAHLRLIDVVGEGDDGQILVLMPEADRGEASSAARAVLDALDVAAARAGVAMCPSDACDADTLVFFARTAARAARPGTVSRPSDVETRLVLDDRTVLLADPATVRVYGLLERLAGSELPVLICGETGVGKENAAYAVHHWSKRGGPFVAVNCAAIGPESLVDSELFGHDKGTFTGATSAKPGLFESAAGGTVFLDEVGELPTTIQSKLLRALETRKVVRLGETRERPIDVRLVAATNRSLDDEVRAGRFRQDLYFRLGGATVILPPLRDRRCEIPMLAREFLAQACDRAGRSPMQITPAAMQVLLVHDWPGNVRELRNAIGYVAAAAPDDVVEPYDLPERLGGAATAAAETPPPSAAPATAEAAADPPAFRPIAEELREIERRRMSEALVAAGGVKSRAAQLIDMPIRTFTLKLKQYKL